MEGPTAAVPGLAVAVDRSCLARIQPVRAPNPTPLRIALRATVSRRRRHAPITRVGPMEVVEAVDRVVRVERGGAGVTSVRASTSSATLNEGAQVLFPNHLGQNVP